jgi:hypothetical protein
MKKFMNERVLRLRIRGQKVKDQIFEKLAEDSGNFIEEVAKYIISIVLAALFLGGLYLLFKNIVLPTLGTKVQDLFNFSA